MDKQMNMFWVGPDYKNWNSGQKAWELLCSVSTYLAKQWVLWFGDIWGQVTLAGIPALTRILSELGDSPFQLWTPVLNWQMENIFIEVFFAGSQKRFKYLLLKRKSLSLVRRNYFLALFPTFLTRWISNSKIQWVPASFKCLFEKMQK